MSLRSVRIALTASFSIACLALGSALTPRTASADDAPAAGGAPSAIVVPCPCQPCAPMQPSCYRLKLTGHAAWLHKEPEGPPGGVPSGLPNQVDWNSLSYGAAFGGGGSFEFPAWCGWRAEVGGTFWGHWDDSTTVTGTLGATQTPGGPVNASPTFDVGLSSKATLWDAEFMLWRPLCTRAWRTDWGFGARFVSFDETSTFTFPQGATTASLTGDATNTLLGAQVGIRTEHCITRCLDFGGELDAFGGWRHTKRELTPDNVVGPAPFTGGTETKNAFGGGLSLDLYLRWRLRCGWSVIGGYGAMLLFQQARGWQLADLSNTASFVLGPKSSSETVWSQRVFLGVQVDF